MTELRAEIDAVDTALFDLFAERMRYIHRAAELKRGTDIPAEVPERVEEVVNNARARAEAHGLDPELYGRFWRELVAAAIAEEEVRLGS
ncbi:chorismate mutase [Mangrovicella endophytica]|uniref:chorismate mutase n=1 Tax=Mangrovicella endophytica TaxID=2066697 RepID=UPI000C9E0918|nr:chorismate mutase [Mangrovicella endophytica]